MVSLLFGLVYESLQIILDNRKNKNLRNVQAKFAKKYIPVKISTYTVNIPRLKIECNAPVCL